MVVCIPLPWGSLVLPLATQTRDFSGKTKIYSCPPCLTPKCQTLWCDELSHGAKDNDKTFRKPRRPKTVGKRCPLIKFNWAPMGKEFG